MNRKSLIYADKMLWGVSKKSKRRFDCMPTQLSPIYPLINKIGIKPELI